jgi:putative flippase GtrA
MKEFVKQMFSFFGGRVATLVVEEIILLVFVTLLAFPSIPVKIVAQILVIVLNYVISKFFVF